jgi:hypothetical protein
LYHHNGFYLTLQAGKLTIKLMKTSPYYNIVAIGSRFFPSLSHPIGVGLFAGACICGNASAALLNLTNDTVFATVTGGTPNSTTVPLSYYTSANNTQERGALVDGALLLQGGVGSGAGVYRRLLQLDSNTPTKDGYNRVVTDNKNGSEFEEKIPNGFNPFVRLNELTPQSSYYSFSLDTNENNNANNKWESLTEIQFYVGAPTDPTTLPITAATLSALGTKIWDLQANPIAGSRNDILLNDTLQSGSGTDNMYLLLPTSLFTGFDQNSFLYSIPVLDHSVRQAHPQAYSLRVLMSLVVSMNGLR